MYIKVIQVILKFKDGILETKIYPAIKDKVLSIKSWATEIKVPTNKAYRIKNCVDKDKVLSVKKLIISKGVVKKYPFGFNPSGCL